MSTFLVSELNAYIGLTTTDTPLLFDVRENTLYACVGDESEKIFKFHESYSVFDSTSTYRSTTFETKNVLDGIDINYSGNTSRASGCEIDLDRSERQDDENNWCVAYVTAAIIRTLTNQDTMAEDIMEWYYGEDVSDDVYITNAEAALYAREVARLTATTHSTGTLSTSRLMEELNYGRPVYLAMLNVNNSSSAHAIALRGYNSSTALWSVWNPTNPTKAYETFPIGGYYSSHTGNVFSYDETIYNFYANWRSS